MLRPCVFHEYVEIRACPVTTVSADRGAAPITAPFLEQSEQLHLKYGPNGWSVSTSKRTPPQWHDPMYLVMAPA